MLLLDLANELLLCISDNLESQRDINAFTRTNHHLYYLLNAHLYVQNFGSSALLWAAEHGREATAQRLLGEGANIQVTVKINALFIAAKKGHSEVVKLLLETKADVSVTDYYGKTALYMAAKNGHSAVVKLLLKAKADDNVTDY